jgi:hypothetical protein
MWIFNFFYEMLLSPLLFLTLFHQSSPLNIFLLQIHFSLFYFLIHPSNLVGICDIICEIRVQTGINFKFFISFYVWYMSLTTKLLDSKQVLIQPFLKSNFWSLFIFNTQLILMLFFFKEICWYNIIIDCVIFSL